MFVLLVLIADLCLLILWVISDMVLVGGGYCCLVFVFVDVRLVIMFGGFIFWVLLFV